MVSLMGSLPRDGLAIHPVEEGICKYTLDCYCYGPCLLVDWGMLGLRVATFGMFGWFSYAVG